MSLTPLYMEKWIIKITIAMCFLITPSTAHVQTKPCEQPGQPYTLTYICCVNVLSTHTDRRSWESQELGPVRVGMGQKIEMTGRILNYRAIVLSMGNVVCPTQKPYKSQDPCSSRGSLACFFGNSVPPPPPSDFKAPPPHLHKVLSLKGHVIDFFIQFSKQTN